MLKNGGHFENVQLYVLSEMSIVFVDPENIEIDTKIGSLSCFVVEL